VRLLLIARESEALTVSTVRLRVYKLFDEYDAITQRYVVHRDSEYDDGVVHINSCETHRSRVRS